MSRADEIREYDPGLYDAILTDAERRGLVYRGPAWQATVDALCERLWRAVQRSDEIAWSAHAASLSAHIADLIDVFSGEGAGRPYTPGDAHELRVWTAAHAGVMSMSLDRSAWARHALLDEQELTVDVEGLAGDASPHLVTEAFDRAMRLNARTVEMCPGFPSSGYIQSAHRVFLECDCGSTAHLSRPLFVDEEGVLVRTHSVVWRCGQRNRAVEIEWLTPQRVVVRDMEGEGELLVTDREWQGWVGSAVEVDWCEALEEYYEGGDVWERFQESWEMMPSDVQGCLERTFQWRGPDGRAFWAAPVEVLDPEILDHRP